MAFNNSGGMRYVGFFGSAKFMSQLPIVGDIQQAASKYFNKIAGNVAGKLKGLSDALKLDKIQNIQKLCIQDKQAAAKEVPAPDGATPDGTGVSAYVGISYNFDTRIFQANFDIYVNTAMGMLQGVGNSYRAGWAEMRFAPGDWHVYMGTPTDPIGLRFGLGGFGIRTSAYFMMGSTIPGSPAPPREVADILGVDLKELDYMRDLNALGDGKGLAFGTSVTVETGDITFLILYANLKAGVGFDVMLKQYPGATCQGSNKHIGIDGWYANAQAWAYFQGEIGVKINLLFIKLRIPIIQGGAAALMQAKLPNPSWFRGYIGLRVSALGGLVKGNMRFRITLGDECTIVGPDGKVPPLGMQVISDITPKDTTNVSVFTAPQVAFNMPVGKDINLADDNGDHTFRVKLEKFEIQKGQQPIAGSLQWNNQNDAVSFYANEILPPSTALKAYVKVSFTEFKNGIWQTVYVDGVKAEEERTLNFITGTAPKEIPLSNIQYCYPVVDQQNFYRDEYNQGYVQLKFGQTYLFNVPGYMQKLSCTSNDGKSINLPYSYDSVARRLRFNITGLSANTNYAINLVSTNLNAGVTKTAAAATTVAGDDGEMITVANKSADNIVRDDVAQILLTYNFHTSKYTTFRAKLDEMASGSSVIYRRASDVISMQPIINPTVPEPFEEAELTGTLYTNMQPMLQPVGIPEDEYYQMDIYPRNYVEYPLAGNITLTRDTSLLGWIPLRALPVADNYLSAILAQRYTAPEVTTRLPYMYDIPMLYKQDFLDLQNKVVNKYLGTSMQARYERFINGYYPFIRAGRYRVRYNYVLPGNQPKADRDVFYINTIR